MKLAPLVTTHATMAPAPNGLAGVHHTLRLMRQMIGAARTDPRIIQAAHSIVYLTPERDEVAEACALYEWVRDHVRYVRDVHGLETLTTPVKVLQRLTGDCDDQTMLLCALAESVGIPTRLVMSGYQSNEFEHVYCQLFAAGQWIDCDCIERSFSFGVAAPEPRVLYVESV